MPLTSEPKIIKSGTQNQSVSNTQNQSVSNKPNNVHTLGHLDQKVRSKFITNQLLFPLIDLKSPLNKSYWHTYYCCNILLQDGKKLTSKYCDHRWCVTCNRIRTAQAIHSYFNEVQSIKDRHFVTISRRNVTERNLRTEIDDLIKDFAKCIRKVKRSLKTKIKAIRKLEITFNPNTNEYHPHFHIITSGHVGNLIIQTWLGMQGIKASIKGQDIRPSNVGDTIELFKYTTKLFKIERKRKTPDGKQIIEIDAKPLDKMFQALKNRKTFQAYGLTKQVPEQIENIMSQQYECLDERIEIWHWDEGIHNWVTALGEILTPTNHSDYYSILIK